MLYTTALLVYDEPSYIQWYKHYHVTAVKGVLRAGSHYRRFCGTLITLGIKICQHTSFLMRPLTCNFLKISNREKTSKTPVYLGGLTNFSKSQKNRGARRQSCQQLKRMTPNIDDKVTNVGKSTKFPYYGRQMPRNEQYSFLQDLGNTPNSACCERRTKKHWGSLFGRMASVVAEHNFTAQISSVWLTLAFSRSIYFISGLIQIDFAANFFKPK